jgi:hypothetical protein
VVDRIVGETIQRDLVDCSGENPEAIAGQGDDAVVLFIYYWRRQE